MEITVKGNFANINNGGNFITAVEVLSASNSAKWVCIWLITLYFFTWLGLAAELPVLFLCPVAL